VTPTLTLILLALGCAGGACLVTLDALLNTQTKRHDAWFFGLLGGVIVCVVWAAWRAFA